MTDNIPITSRRVFRPESHLDHCFGYLRQVWYLNLAMIHSIANSRKQKAIMCAGDLALESSVVPVEFGFNCWGTSNQCADWRIIWDTATAHRYMYAPDEEM